jgi:DNA mismatch endonuclease, patch repair protein
MRSFLVRSSLRGWKINDRTLFGIPDFVFPRAAVAVFIDGCFWHQCPSCGRPPKSNLGYWSEKLKRNKKRDRLVTATLRQTGWSVLRFWEHEVANNAPAIMTRLSTFLKH